MHYLFIAFSGAITNERKKKDQNKRDAAVQSFEEQTIPYHRP